MPFGTSFVVRHREKNKIIAKTNIRVLGIFSFSLSLSLKEMEYNLIYL
jgi:hypothetical protein